MNTMITPALPTLATSTSTAHPDAALFEAVARFMAALAEVKSLSWPRDGDAAFDALRRWHEVFDKEIAPARPVTELGIQAKAGAEALFAGPAPQG